MDASAHLGGLRLAQKGLAHFEEVELCQDQHHARPAAELCGTAEKLTWLHAPGEGVRWEVVMGKVGGLRGGMRGGGEGD